MRVNITAAITNFGHHHTAEFWKFFKVHFTTHTISRVVTRNFQHYFHTVAMCFFPIFFSLRVSCASQTSFLPIKSLTITLLIFQKFFNICPSQKPVQHAMHVYCWFLKIHQSSCITTRENHTIFSLHYFLSVFCACFCNEHFFRIFHWLFIARDIASRTACNC